MTMDLHYHKPLSMALSIQSGQVDARQFKILLIETLRGSWMVHILWKVWTIAFNGLLARMSASVPHLACQYFVHIYTCVLIRHAAPSEFLSSTVQTGDPAPPFCGRYTARSASN